MEATYEERQQARSELKAAAARLESAAQGMKEALVPLGEAIELAPPELLQDLADANLNAHHSLGRLNTARALLQRLNPDA